MTGDSTDEIICKVIGGPWDGEAFPVTSTTAKMIIPAQHNAGKSVYIRTGDELHYSAEESKE